MIFGRRTSTAALDVWAAKYAPPERDQWARYIGAIVKSCACDWIHISWYPDHEGYDDAIRSAPRCVREAVGRHGLDFDTRVHDSDSEVVEWILEHSAIATSFEAGETDILSIRVSQEDSYLLLFSTTASELSQLQSGYPELVSRAAKLDRPGRGFSTHRPG